MIIEVLSPSPERYDRGVKVRHYRTMGTLQAYLLIAQDRKHIEHYTRQPSGQWLFEEATLADAQITLPSVDCILSVQDTYEKVDLLAEADDLPRDGVATG